MTDVDKLIERLDGQIKTAALDLVSAYFGRLDKSLATIPADPKNDADIILCEGICEAAHALAAQQKRIAELEDAINEIEEEAERHLFCVNERLARIGRLSRAALDSTGKGGE